MIKNLVIVESPAKARTIEKFLGKDYSVMSSMGHVMDLSKKDLSVDVENGFAPQYEVSPDKKKIVSDLKKSAKGAEWIWLATDEDREGEAISWHLVNALKLDESKIKRIVFHEITKTAIQEAINNPRTIDTHLVMAQQARRVLDRLVGYELSPLLWRKVKPSLSAGRVQSVAVRLIVEREEEVKNFKSTSVYKITANFEIASDKKKSILKAELPKRFKTKKEAQEFLEKCNGADFWVDKVETKPAKKSPAPPFTTSTLQQEASRKLGFSVGNTMRVAQNLYESGKITYMRTDSVNLSKLAIAQASEEITNSYGEEYVKTRQFATKTKGAQEAHEAIRPTFMNSHEVSGNAQEKKLYELIWKRAIASQMSDAQIQKTTVDVGISTSGEKLVAKGEVIKFDGFLKVYLEGRDDEDSEEKAGVLPAMKKGDELNLEEMLAVERFSKHPPRYSEASLVKKMEELGIGRPSTYAPTISTIQKREYVVKDDRDGISRQFGFMMLAANKITEETKTEQTGFEKGKLFPTDLGTVVNKFLMQFFDDILEYNFTANVEKEFDEIAQGQKDWNTMIGEFYGPFHAKVAETAETTNKFSGERLLGLDPKSGKNVFAKIGRYGAMIQIGDTESEEKPKFAGMRKEQSIDTIELEEALKLFDFPRLVGEYEGEELTVSIGRFGPYVKHNKLFFSLKKEDNPSSIGQERAIELIEEKRKKESDNIICKYDEDPKVQVLKGRYGPYIKIEKQNIKIPKDRDPETLTLKDCYEIAEDPANQPKKKFRKKK
jgi:DNA topoisomerase I